MRRWIFIVFFTTNVFGQFATFRADTNLLWYYSGNNREVYEGIMEMEWTINRKKFRFGSKPIEIKVDNILDTLLYRNKKDSLDTFICNINRPLNYVILYNHCCNSFDVSLDGKKKITCSIKFTIINSSSRTLYLGTLGEDGVFVGKGSEQILVPHCSVPTTPNIYDVSLREIKNCHNSSGCGEHVCLLQSDPNAMPDFLDYKTLRSICFFRLLPLGETLEVIYDAGSGELRVE